MHNQGGSSAIVMFLILPVGLTIGFFAISYIDWLGGHARLQAQDRVVEDSANLQTHLKMLLTSRESCRQSLNPSGFGASVASLTSAGSVQVLIPELTGSTGSGQKVFIHAQSRYQNVQITDVLFDQTSFIASALEKSYTIDLLVKYRNAFNKAEKSLRIPIYFTADSSGNLVDCLATAYTSAGSTVEDLICQQNFGTDYLYLPGQQTCALKSSSMAQN